MTWRLVWALAPVVAFAATASPVLAQQSPNCARLENQLQAFDRSAADPARADQIRRFEEAADNQQNEIDRQQATAQRIGCENNSFFVLFSRQPQQCGRINAKIRQMRANLDRIHADLERLQGASGPEQASQRRAILVALAQNNCGQQYRAAVAAAPPPRSGGRFEARFGPGTIFSPGGGTPGWSGPGGTYRTVCVRTCDGYYFPISFATMPDHFGEDEKVCQRSCPAAEVMLFAYHNPGEDISQAVSISGQLYSTLPNAFRYRQAFNASCSCRHPGETWAQALKHLDDPTVERGDIVVNPDRARLMSQPRFDAKGRPIKPDARAVTKPDTKASKTGRSVSDPKAAETPPPAAMVEAKPRAAATKPDPNRQIRSVGPTFIPTR
jgi:hypothetical protein